MVAALGLDADVEIECTAFVDDTQVPSQDTLLAPFGGNGDQALGFFESPLDSFDHIQRARRCGVGTSALSISCSGSPANETKSSFSVVDRF